MLQSLNVQHRNSISSNHQCDTDMSVVLLRRELLLCGGYYCSHWHQCLGLILYPQTPMLEDIIVCTGTNAKVIIASAGTNGGTKYCIHRRQCCVSTGTNAGGYFHVHWNHCLTLLCPMAPMLGSLLYAFAGGCYCVHWHQCWGLILCALAPMLEAFIECPLPLFWG